MAIIKDPEVEPGNYEIEGESRQQRVMADLHQGCSGATARHRESCKAATAATATFFALLYDGGGVVGASLDKDRIRCRILVPGEGEAAGAGEGRGRGGETGPFLA